MQHVFIQMVQPGAGTSDTRRLATHTELERDWVLVTRLATERLVVTGEENRHEEHEEKPPAPRPTVQVAHEALITTWERLRGWMNGDRAFRTWQERLRLDMRRWEKSGHGEDTLLRGAPLAEAEGWLAERGGDLPPQERVYIEAGVALREREQVAKERLRRNILVGSVGTALVLLVLLVLAGWQWWRAEQEAAIAFSRQLAADSGSQQERYIDLSLLLAMQSDIVTSTLESQRAIGEAISVSPHLSTTLHSHTSAVWSVAFSPDGQTLASAGDDTVRLWRVADGQALRTLTGHTNDVNSVAFSPDGQTLASASSDNTVRLWPASVASWKAIACRMVNRNLSLEEWRQYMGDRPYEKTCPGLPVGEGVE